MENTRFVACIPIGTDFVRVRGLAPSTKLEISVPNGNTNPKFCISN